MTPDEIMRELARNDIFPKDAMAAATAQRDVMAPVFVDLLDRISRQRSGSMSDSDLMALIPVTYLLGQWREIRAYRPLLRLLRRSTRTLDLALGDAVTESAFRMVAGTFDGDLAPLFEAIMDLSADDFARGAMMSALVLLAQLDPTRRSEIENFIRNFLSRQPKAPADLLISWTDVVADLGLEDMTETVRTVFDKGMIPKDYSDFSHFLDDLEATRAAGGVPASRRYRQGLIEDAVEELSRWYCYTDAYFEKQKAQKENPDPRVIPMANFVRNLVPTAGRNDPCPCGSGKKFKKCCLQ
jgi:hypothetical protein